MILPAHMRVKIFADCGSLEQIKAIAADPLIHGVTTNPTLMRKAGIVNYEAFCRAAAEAVHPKPISFEVFADDPIEIRKQAFKIGGWADNIWVKVPITNTDGKFLGHALADLAQVGVRLNVTAIMTMSQVVKCIDVLADSNDTILSIFAGRVADTGRDPSVTIRSARGVTPINMKILWASAREVLNLWQAEKAGADIITLDPALLAKLTLAGKSLTEFSLDTVKMFYNDAKAAGYSLEPKPEAVPVGSYGGGGF